MVELWLGWGFDNNICIDQEHHFSQQQNSEYDMNIMQRQKHEENRHGDQENLLVVAGTRRAQW